MNQNEPRIAIAAGLLAAFVIFIFSAVIINHRSVTKEIAQTQQPTQATQAKQPVFGAPFSVQQRTIIPETNDLYELGTSSKEWLRVFAKQFNTGATSSGCATFTSAGALLATGVACGTGGGGGGVWPFTTSDTNYGVPVQSTTTPEWFKTPVNGVFSLMASGTAAFVNSSTTNATVFSNFYLPYIGAYQLLETDGNKNVIATTSIGWNMITGGPAGANPTASVGLSAVNGSNTTYMRSDGSPPLDQTISPVMTGAWAFNNTASTTVAKGFSASVIAAQYFISTSSTATSTFANGIDLAAGVGCFSVSGTCLQTIVSSASAYKQAVRYAATTTLPANTYSNGVGGVGATLTGVALAPFYIDGNTPSVGDRVLVKNESAGANNGIYTVTTVGIASVSAYVLTRATDYNSSADVFPGVANFVNSGTQNANTCWILTNTSAVTIGTTALTYADECGAGSFSATSPIMLLGTTFSFSGITTSTAPTIGNLAYWTSASTLGTVATGTISSSGGITTTALRSAVGGPLSISCDVASASAPGCLPSADWTTFNGKLNLVNLYTQSNTYATAALATSTSFWFQGKIFASSTAAAPSVIDNFTFNNATGTNATTTNMAITSVKSALYLANANGSVIPYAGASACSANNFVTTLSAVGGTTCGTASISGVNLGSNLNSLSVSGDISGTTYNGSATVSDWAFVMSTAHTWTGLQNTSNSGTSTNAGGYYANLIAASYFDATSTTATSSVIAGLSVGRLNITSATASSTAANGFQLASGCFQMPSGVCLSTTATLSGGTTGLPAIWTSATALGATSTLSLTAFNATSTAATSTFAGNVMIGTSGNSGWILGSTTPFQLSCSFNSFCETLFWNTNTGSNANTQITFNNNHSTAAAYYGEIGINGGNYANALFSGQRADDLFLDSSDAGIDFALASTTAFDATSSIDFLTKGTLSSNLRMRIANSGLIMMGTSTPSWGLLTLATSTASQLTLVDGITGNVGWGLRAINNNLYFATTTSNGTSTPLLTFSSNYGIGIASTTPQAGGLTIGWGNLIMASGQMTNQIASSTDPTQFVTIDWDQSNEVRVIASTTLNLIINATSSHPRGRGGYTIDICQDGTGNRTINFITPGQLVWGNGTTTIASGAGRMTKIGMFFDSRVARYAIVASSTFTDTRLCIP